jgi:branched-chain amino acid transport system ATP-binding protein
MLEVKDIHTWYGDSYTLQGVTLEVKDATVVALLGRNGMGKTTTIRSIMGLTPPRMNSSASLPTRSPGWGSGSSPRAG